ncbi:hypothetical protein JCM11491_000104 [Sporobolomyces phaffii]
MATFSKATFNATKYAASRPHYPPALYAHVLEYASTPDRHTVLDVGCGPGLSTFAFASEFDHVIGVDPSRNMVHHARDLASERELKGDVATGRVRFEQGSVDQLDQVVSPNSVDLVVAAQAAHWFDPVPAYASILSVLKPGGAFVFWGYGEISFPARPELSALIPPYSGGLLGPYWEQPGRSIVEHLLVPFPLPLASNFDSPPSPPSSSSSFSASASASASASRVCSGFDPASLRRTFDSANDASTAALSAAELAANVETTVRDDSLLTKRWTLDDLEGYLRTWSSLHRYEQERPPGSSSSSSSSPDVVEALLRQLEDRGWRRGEEVEARWQVGMLMGRKKQN